MHNNTTMFFSGDPKKGEDIYPDFQVIYPIPQPAWQSRVATKVDRPVIDAVTESSKERRIFSVHLLDGSKFEVDVTAVRGDDELEYMVLEEAVQERMITEEIPGNAWIRVH